MYKAEITYSSKELRAKERISVKDLSAATKLADQGECDGLIIEPDFWATVHVDNDKSENPSYDVFVIVAKDGQHFYTSSSSFISAFEDIASDMKDEDEEWAIKVIFKPSKNYNGRAFITCTII